MGKNSILIVDDDLILLKTAEEILSSIYTVSVAKSGKQAITLLKKGVVPDLILLDIAMPEMDGYEATRRIRAITDKEKSVIPIVAMTANAFEDDRKNAFDVGMNGHIAKPFDIKKLIHVLTKLMK